MNHEDEKERRDEAADLSAVLILDESRFPLGMVVVAQRAYAALSTLDIHHGLVRHASGDWGELCEDDWAENQTALQLGYRLLSGYRSSKGIRFWIITEADRSVTTVLLPEEY